MRIYFHMDREKDFKSGSPLEIALPNEESISFYFYPPWRAKGLSAYIKFCFHDPFFLFLRMRFFLIDA